MAKFKIGDTVVVKEGVKDPDFDTDLGGWYGRIQAINPINKKVVEIGWDSITLRTMPPEILTFCFQESLDFAAVTLLTDEIEPGQPRDTIEETQEILTILNTQRTLMLSEENDEDDDLAVDFFAPIAAHLAGEDMDWDEEGEFFDEEQFDIDDFFILLEIPAKEQPLVKKCFAAGLYNYYFDIYGYAKFGKDVDWLINERMYEPFIFGYGTVAVIQNKKLSDDTKLKVIAYTLSITSPTEEYGIPFGLLETLHYLAQKEELEVNIFSLIMITLHANPGSSYDEMPPGGWLDLSRWVINSPDISADETLWWLWHFSTKFADWILPAQGKKVVSYWLDHKDLANAGKRELCWCWLNECTDIDGKPLTWQLIDAQMSGDVKALKSILEAFGTPRSEISAALRDMEQIQAELHDPALGLPLSPGVLDWNFVWFPKWLKRTAVPALVMLGEDLSYVCSNLLDAIDEDGAAINKGVADAVSRYGDQLPPAELRPLLEKGLTIPQVETRKAFYRLSKQFYGDEYLPQTQNDAAASIRRWGKKELQK